MARYKDIDAIIEKMQGSTAETWGKGLGRSWWSHSVMLKDNIVQLMKDAPEADVVETKRISEILAVLFENNIVEKYIPNTANAGSWEDFLRKACSGEYGMLR
jgi:hypothetical protein